MRNSYTKNEAPSPQGGAGVNTAARFFDDPSVTRISMSPRSKKSQVKLRKRTAKNGIGRQQRGVLKSLDQSIETGLQGYLNESLAAETRPLGTLEIAKEPLSALTGQYGRLTPLALGAERMQVRLDREAQLATPQV